LCISWIMKCLIIIDARCEHEDLASVFAKQTNRGKSKTVIQAYWAPYALDSYRQLCQIPLQRDTHRASVAEPLYRNTLGSCIRTAVSRNMWSSELNCSRYIHCINIMSHSFPIYRVAIKEIDTFNVVLKRNY
jgi:hypothetical protein